MHSSRGVWLTVIAHAAVASFHRCREAMSKCATNEVMLNTDGRSAIADRGRICGLSNGAAITNKVSRRILRRMMSFRR